MGATVLAMACAAHSAWAVAPVAAAPLLPADDVLPADGKAQVEGPAVAPPPADAATRTDLLPIGTTVLVTMDQTLSSKDNAMGDGFSVTVAQDVLAGGAVAIAKGTKGTGEVTFRTGKGGFGKGGILGIALRTLDLGGKHYLLDGRYREEGKNANGGAAAVMFVGGILAVAVQGKGSVIEQGRVLKARTGDAIPYVAAGGASPPPAAETAAAATNATTTNDNIGGRDQASSR